MEKLGGFLPGPQPEDDLDRVRQLVSAFQNLPDDEKVAFFIDHFKQELFAVIQQKANSVIEKDMENVEELDSAFEAREHYYKVLTQAAALVAQCLHKSTHEARAFLFGIDWAELPIEKLRAKKSQLQKSFHTDKTKTLAWQVHLMNQEEEEEDVEQRVRADMEKFTAATVCVNQVGRAIEQEREKRQNVQKRVHDLERKAKVWEGRAREHTMLARQDTSSLLWESAQEAAKQARELWDDLMRLLDDEAVDPDHIKRIRVRLSIAEACIMEGLPANVAQLYVIGSKRLWHQSWPLDPQKQRDHNVLLKTILQVEQAVHAPGACSSELSHGKEASSEGHEVPETALALLPTACRGQRLRSDLQVSTAADLDRVLQSTRQFDMDAYQLMVPTLEVARCDVSSPMCRTLQRAQQVGIALGSAGLTSGAVCFAWGSMIGCAFTGGAGLLLLAIGGSAGVATWRKTAQRGNFLKHLHHLVRESHKALQTKGAEAFLETLCMPLPSSTDLGGASGKRVLNYPHTLEEPLKDLKGSVKFLLEWDVCPVFIGQLLLQVAEIFASRRIKKIKVDGEPHAPMYNRLKIQAEDILTYLEASAAKDGELYLAARAMDEAASREEALTVKATATFQADQGSLLEDHFKWSTSWRAWYLQKPLPHSLPHSNNAQVGMIVQKATLHKEIGSVCKSDLKNLTSLAKLFAESGVSRIELEFQLTPLSSFKQLASSFVKDMPAKDEQQVQMLQLLQVTRINMAMLLLLNQDAAQEEDGNIKKAELILQKVLSSVQASDTSYDLEIRVKAVRTFSRSLPGAS